MFSRSWRAAPGRIPHTLQPVRFAFSILIVLQILQSTEVTSSLFSVLQPDQYLGISKSYRCRKNTTGEARGVCDPNASIIWGLEQQKTYFCIYSGETTISYNPLRAAFKIGPCHGNSVL